MDRLPTPSALNGPFIVTAFAILAGAAVPSLVLGRAVLAVSVGLTFLLLLISELRAPAWRTLVEQAKTPLGIGIALTVSFWAVSAMGSAFPVRSLEAVLRSGLFVCLGVMVFGALQSAPALQQTAMKGLIATTAIGGMIAIVATLALPEFYWLLRLKGWTSSPIGTAYKAYTSLSVVLVPILALYALRARGVWRGAAIVAIAAFVFLVWILYSRAAIAGFLGIVLALTIAQLTRSGGRRRILFFGSGILAAFAAVFVWLRTTRGHQLNLIPENDWLFPVWLVDFQRQTIWSYSLKIYETVPWFGIGPNTINFTPGADQPLPGNESLNIIPAHPHNWLVEVLTETGGIGLAALLGVLMLCGVYLLLVYRRTGALGYLAAIAIFAGYWTSGLFNFSYWSAWWQVSFVFTMAISTASRSLEYR